jgi:hypothetical protein
VSPEPQLRTIIATVLLLLGVATLLIAALLAVWTTVGWPKLTLTALLLLVVAGILIARNMRIPS